VSENPLVNLAGIWPFTIPQTGTGTHQSRLVLYVWPELTNRFFKTTKFPQNEVWDGKIIENEGGLRLGV
jgi:hypothetical protein